MKTLIGLSVLASCALALFRSSSYSYSSDSPYYSSSSYYTSDSYYTTSYRSNSRYANNDYKSYTYMDGSTKPTVSKEALSRAVINLANGGRVIESVLSFNAGKLRYYMGTQYMPSQDCGGGGGGGKRSKRNADSLMTSSAAPRGPAAGLPATSTVLPRGAAGGNGTSGAPTVIYYYPSSTMVVPGGKGGPDGTVLPPGIGSTPPPPPGAAGGNSGTTKSSWLPFGGSSLPSIPNGGLPATGMPNYTGSTGFPNTGRPSDAVSRPPPGADNGNFSDYKDVLAYMNMFYVNFSNPADTLNYVETYLPDNFTKGHDNSTAALKDAVSSLPINTTRYGEVAKSMLDSNGGNINKSVEDWYNDMKDEQSYNDMIGNTTGSGPVQTQVGCSQNSAVAVCTRSFYDLDSSVFSYAYSPAFPSEIAWQCPDKDYYCCEWECCKEKRWSVGGIVATVILFLMAFSCCCCLCCLCAKGKQREKETTVIAMYPKPQPQAYFISIPPRVYY